LNVVLIIRRSRTQISEIWINSNLWVNLRFEMSVLMQRGHIFVNIEEFRARRGLGEDGERGRENVSYDTGKEEVLRGKHI